MSKPVKFRHYPEYMAVYCLMTLFHVIGLDAASALGGWLARKIGPFTGIHRIARRQIIEIRGDDAVDQILTGMWNNLGRTIAEYAHLREIAASRITIDNRTGHPIPELIKNQAMYIAGHFANWEVAALTLFKYEGHTPDLIYRPPNNPLVDKLLHRYRSMAGEIRTYPKSRQGMRDVIGALSDGRSIGILIDQKYNEGVALPFFGRPAMTSTAFAALAQRFQCPIFPVQIMRTKGANFTVILHPALDQAGTTEEIATNANTLLEGWMLEHPEQWLWIHQRWSSKAVQDSTQDREELEADILNL